MREAFEPKGLLITCTLSTLYWILDVAYDLPKLSKYVNYASVKSFEYRGAWNSHTGLGSSLYAPSGNDTRNDMVSWARH